ncbi:LuxR C-terminal-related transcriptional regulator [Bacillus sp. IITD106]|nr:LuxR C-terminal-related transcriptional regulator [Bacillus sp. IITD106]
MDTQAAWVSLDRNDNNVLRFWTHVIESLNVHYSLFDEPFTSRYIDADPSGDTLIATLINRLNRISEQVILVWDDFHSVEGDSIMSGVNYLLERLPAHVHIYIASRIQPFLSLSRLRVEGNLVELGMDDLRFGREESKAFFNQCTDLSLSKEECLTIYTKTEGWIAGMRVATLSMNSHAGQNTQTKSVLEGMSGNQRNFADYFFEEVLTQQSEEMQQFLLKTSVLERMNAALSEAMTNIPNGKWTLQQLEKENLFLIALDDEREWFRYHHLFQEFLRMQLQIRYPEQVKLLHLVAGQWLEENNFTEEALDHYLCGEWYREALHLLQRFIPALPSHKWAAVHNWLNVIPDHLLLKKPALFLTNIASLYLSGYVEESTEKYWWAINELQQGSNPLSQRETQQFLAGLDFLVAFRSFLEKDFDYFIQYSQKYLEREPSGDLLIGFGSGLDGYHPAWDIYLSNGSLAKAEEMLQALVEMWSKTKNKPFYAHLCMDYGKLLYEWNRLDEANTYIRQALAIGKEVNNVSLIVKASLLMAQIEFIHNRLEKVDMRIKQLLEYVDQEKHSSLLKNIEIFQVWIGLRQKKREPAFTWVQKNNLSSADEISTAMLEDYALLVRILGEQGKEEEALGLTNRLLYIAEDEGKHGIIIRLTIYKSLLFAKQSKVVASFQVLEDALCAGKVDGYTRTFLDEGEAMKNLLTEYVASIRNHHYDYLRKEGFTYAKRLLELITLQGANGALPPLETKEIASENRLTPTERMVLTYILQGLSNRAIAGELGVSLSTVKTHINNMYRKLGVNNRVLALQKAQEMGLL